MAVLLNASNLSKAVSQLSSVGWTYRWDTVTLECPASFIIVNASAPASPNRVRKVWRSPWRTNSRGNTACFFPSTFGSQTRRWRWSRLVTSMDESGESPGKTYGEADFLRRAKRTAEARAVRERVRCAFWLFPFVTLSEPYFAAPTGSNRISSHLRFNRSEEQTSE